MRTTSFLLFVMAVIFAFTSNTFAQYNRRNQKDNHRAVILDSTLAKKQYVITRPAAFPGGLQKFYVNVLSKVKYPRDAKRQKIEGKVNVAFVIDSTGTVLKESVRIVQSLSPSCDEEAMRVIRSSPEWMPAFSAELNRNVNQWMMVPVNFKLR